MNITPHPNLITFHCPECRRQGIPAAGEPEEHVILFKSRSKAFNSVTYSGNCNNGHKIEIKTTSKASVLRDVRSNCQR